MLKITCTFQRLLPLFLLCCFQTLAFAQVVHKDYTGYLFAYFEGSGTKETQEQLRLAVSQDALNWFALNNNEPIIPSTDISQTGGIRDPHLLRGQHGEAFYLVATDMFT